MPGRAIISGRWQPPSEFNADFRSRKFVNLVVLGFAKSPGKKAGPGAARLTVFRPLEPFAAQFNFVF